MSAERTYAPIRWGDRVQLGNGGPVCLVVDLPCPDVATIAWRQDRTAREASLPLAFLQLAGL